MTIAQTFIIYWSSRRGGYFLYGESDEPHDLGGTHDPLEARAFPTKRAAQKVIDAFPKSAYDEGAFWVLKFA
jgi:hypothetical protein